MIKSPSIKYSRAGTDDELSQILEIQQRNTKKNLSLTQVETEGFVTVIHDLSVLRKMNNACPHILAKKGNRVIGYALAMVPLFSPDVPALVPLFNLTTKLLTGSSYLVMGQICIDKLSRKQGVFRGIYKYYQQELSHQFQFLVTEVAVENQRSLRAHKSIGFETLYQRVEHGIEWELLVWGWRMHMIS